MHQSCARFTGRLIVLFSSMDLDKWERDAQSAGDRVGLIMCGDSCVSISDHVRKTFVEVGVTDNGLADLNTVLHEGNNFDALVFPLLEHDAMLFGWRTIDLVEADALAKRHGVNPAVVVESPDSRLTRH